MSFRASTINANVALQMLIYRGNADSNGFDELIIAVNDLANSGTPPVSVPSKYQREAEEAEDDEAGCFDKDLAVAMNTGFGLRRNESLINRMVEIHGLMSGHTRHLVEILRAQHSRRRCNLTRRSLPASCLAS